MSAKALNAAWNAIAAGDPQAAIGILDQVLAASPRLAEAHRLLGMAWRQLQRPIEAEAAFKAAIASDKKDPAHPAEYAAFLESTGRIKEAERAFRAALSINRRSLPAATGLALMLLDQDRAAEALQVTTPLAVADKPATSLLAIKARAQQQLGRLADAEATLRALLAQEPHHAQAHIDLAEFIWTRTGDSAAAIEPLDATIASAPNAPVLRVAKARVLTQIDRQDDAPAEIDAALALSPNEPALLAARARLSGSEGLAYAEQALAIRPDDPDALGLAARAALMAGKGERAAELAAQLVALNPLDQFNVALQATAWRMLGDLRYVELYDYDRTVRVTELDTPKGWPGLDAYLADLADALNGMHAAKAHPFGQSVRGGSQVAILAAKHPAVAAVHQALQAPVNDAIAAFAANGHPLGKRATPAWRYSGMWSVKLRSAGYHENHIHSAGWLSSACYIQLPPLKGEEGWLKLGEPGLKLTTPLPPERLIEPKPGRLVLFPSYMWHGTVPFTSEAARLSVAFDVVPA